MASGFILINKRVGVTSRSVDNKVQRLFHTKKVGHLGTLDPFASGLLVIAVDKGCKALPFIDDSFKTYRAKLKLEEKTSTGDLTGEIIAREPFIYYDLDQILDTFEDFLGEREQIPPMTSAIHHEGRRLYDLARSGVEVERKPRKIIIKSLKALGFDGKILEFEVICSRGTYVRTLAEDIAEALGTVGHLVALERVAIGDIDISRAKDIDEITEGDLIDSIDLINLKHVIIEDESIIKDIKDGKDINLDEKEDQILLCYKENNKLVSLAVYSHEENQKYVPVRGLW